MDRRLNKPINTATQIVVIDFPGTQTLDIAAGLICLRFVERWSC